MKWTDTPHTGTSMVPYFYACTGQLFAFTFSSQIMNNIASAPGILHIVRFLELDTVCRTAASYFDHMLPDTSTKCLDDCERSGLIICFKKELDRRDAEG